MPLPSDLWIVLTWTGMGAIVLLLTAMNIWLGLRAKSLRPVYRWMALVPPAAPFIAFAGGRRVLPILWLLSVIAYVIVRLVT